VRIFEDALNNPQFYNDNDFNLHLRMEAAGDHMSESDGEGLESAPSHNSELWPLIEGLLGSVIGSLGASGGVVRVVSANSQMLQIAGAIGIPFEICDYESVVDIGCGVCGKAAYDREVHASNAATCVQRSGLYFSDARCNYVVATPLEYRGNLIGVFSLFFAAPEDVPNDISQSLRTFSELIGIAIESARKKIESQRVQLMSERQSMANEIHDSLAHTLYYARMRMGLLLEAVRTQNEQLALKCAHDLDEALGSGQKTMREIITHFRCQMDPLGLQHALQTLVDKFRDHTDITIIYANCVTNLELPLEHELQVFHIVREALANVATHSSATHASLTVECKDNYYVFTIADNGAGYGSVPSEGHYGLMIMRERALRIGGEIVIESAEGNGTRVQLRFSVSGI
jgi:two-component system nitrate/nitrite sensor histidine kinase NarX